MRPGRFRKKASSLSFSPLIPVMNLFLLLLPFVIQNTMLQKLTTLEMQLPTVSEAAASADRSPQITIDMRRDSIVVFVGGDSMAQIPFEPGFEGVLRNRLVELKAKYPAKKDVVLKVDYFTKYQNVVSIVDVCKRDGSLFPEVVYLDEVD